VGVDLGATTMLAITVDEGGEVYSCVEADTGAGRGIYKVMNDLYSLIYTALDAGAIEAQDFKGVGVGVCGLVDFEQGLFITAPNISDVEHMPLADKLSAKFSRPALIDNDANCSAYGEWWQGVGQGCDNLICLTLGTSIGGGIVIGGKLYRGSHFHAGEFGHMTVEPGGERCPCGNKGCLGILGSASGLVIYYKRRVAQGSVTTWSGGREPTPKDIYELYKAGDSAALGAVIDLARILGLGCANILNIFDPDMLVLAGGLTAMGEDLMQPLRLETRSHTFPAIYKRVAITISGLGKIAGAMGAGGLLWHSDKLRRG